MDTHIYLILSMMIVSSGCVETIIMDPYEKDLPVMVNCILEIEKNTQTLYLQYVKGKSQVENLQITEAKVSICFRESGYSKTAEFHYVGDSRWELEDPFFKVVPGYTYNLTVEMPNRKTITAVTTAPFYTYLDIKGNHYQTETMMPDPPFDDIYFKSTLNKDELTGPVWIFANKGRHASNESAENRYLDLVTDHPYADNFNINGQYFSDLIIDGGPINDDKHLRHTWPAFKNMRKTMPNLPLYEGFIRISRIDDNPFHLLAGPLRYMESYGDHFDFYFVSEEYDSYLRSVYIRDHRLDYDFASIFSSENIYSNIAGGVGIFGCYVLTSTVFLTNL